MRTTLPLPLTDNLIATLQISVRMGSEMRAHAARLGTDAGELQDMAEEKLKEARQLLAKHFRVESLLPNDDE